MRSLLREFVVYIGLFGICLPTEAANAILRELKIHNQCKLPVVFHEAGKQVVRPGQTVSFADDSVDMTNHRISLSYENVYINENLAILELNGMFTRIGQLTPKRNVNFVAQWGFIDLPMDVAFWADRSRTRLACRDGRARCNYQSHDCKAITDGSASYHEKIVAGQSYGFCRSDFSLGDSRTCVGDYATYVNDQCSLYDRESETWNTQARSVGYMDWGWSHGSFSDGLLESTRNGREKEGTAVTYECWEYPCVQNREKCAAAGHTSVGNSGFAINCDIDNGLLDVAVLELTACPTESGTSASASAPSAASDPVVSERLEGVIKNKFGICIRGGASQVQMWGCSDDKALQWKYEAASGLIRHSSGKCLEASNVHDNGADVHLRTCNAQLKGQLWQYSADSAEIVNRHGICLDASQRQVVGGRVHMWSCYPQNKNQRFSVGVLLEEDKSGVVGPVLIHNPHGKCLRAVDPTSNGGKVEMSTCSDNEGKQQWMYVPKTGQVKSANGHCLDASQRNTLGGRVHLWECNTENRNQQWDFHLCQSCGANSVRAGLLKNRRGICLDAAERTFEGGLVHMWECNDLNKNQRWFYDDCEHSNDALLAIGKPLALGRRVRRHPGLVSE